MLEYFTDPVLRAPTLGCMLMCLSASVVGVIAVLKKESLLGEALSHATYPGVFIGVLLSSLFFQEVSAAFIMAGGFLTALLSLYLINWLETSCKVKPDAALCFTLATFFGTGIALASLLQQTHTSLYQEIQIYLYGQAASMLDFHIALYGALSLFILSVVALFYKELQAVIFDREFATSLGIHTKTIDTLVFLLIVLAVVIGIRSVGVVLMSAMFIGPAVAARQFTHHFSQMLLLSALFGLASGFLGVYLSAEASDALATLFPGERLSLATGPMIVVVATFFALLSLFFAPERGFMQRAIRRSLYRLQCQRENILKTLARSDKEQGLTIQQIVKKQNISLPLLYYLLLGLRSAGWVEKKQEHVCLTSDGKKKALRIVRLHRLWEVYLVNYLEVGSERVHKSAEEMEHILTEEMEKELDLLLKYPRMDPHHQPIPEKQETFP